MLVFPLHRLEITKNDSKVNKLPDDSIWDHVGCSFAVLIVALQAAPKFKEAKVFRQENNFEMVVSCSVYTVVYASWFEG